MANANSGDTINFAMSPACSTITLAGTIDITTNLTVVGPGSGTLAVTNSRFVSAFNVASGVAATIAGLTIENSSAPSGGGIYNNGTLTVLNSTITNNSVSGPNLMGGGEGGGIYNNGALTVLNSTLTSNVAGGFSGGLGGGIYNNGTLIVTNSTLADNGVSGHALAPTDGGGIFNLGTATITNSTFSSNSVVYSGAGGIGNSGVLTITNSTLWGNSNKVFGPGTGIAIGNSGTVLLTATIVADSVSELGGGGQLCSGQITDKGYNIDNDGSCGFTAPSISDSPVLAATLGPLSNNGGPTETIALLSGNPGIDYTSAADCPPADQRSLARTTPCDIGAYDTDHGPSGLQITTTSLPNALPKVSYSAPLAASGGNPPYRWKISAGKLPKGLHLKKSTGVISGRPNRHDSGTYTFTVKVVEKKIKMKHQPPTQNSATKVLSITIS